MTQMLYFIVASGVRRWLVIASISVSLTNEIGTSSNWGVLLYGLSIRIAASEAFSSESVALFTSGWGQDDRASGKTDVLCFFYLL